MVVDESLPMQSSLIEALSMTLSLMTEVAVNSPLRRGVKNVFFGDEDKEDVEAD